MDTIKKPGISVSWSGGKDSALALYKIIQRGDWSIDHLHTVFDLDTHRVGMHGIDEELIEAQAEVLGIPLRKLFLKPAESTGKYQELMQSYYGGLRDEGIAHVMFGDIFLEDLKVFRDTMLTSAGLEGLYPLWGADSSLLINEFLSLGFKSVICAADKSKLSKEVLGKEISKDLIKNHFDPIDP